MRRHHQEALARELLHHLQLCDADQGAVEKAFQVMTTDTFVTTLRKTNTYKNNNIATFVAFTAANISNKRNDKNQLW